MQKNNGDDNVHDEGGHVFHTEEEVLNEAHEIIANESTSVDDLRQAYVRLTENYSKLLHDVKFLTRYGDKLQNKLLKINESLTQKTRSLEQAQRIIQSQNEELLHAKQHLEDTVKDRTEDLNQAYNDLLNINKELDDFVYRASHDIRGPLRRFLGLCMLGKMESAEEIALSYFDKLQHTAFEMDDILQKLQAINKLKKSTLHFEQVDVRELMETIIANVQQKENFRSVQVSLNPISSLYIITDKKMMEIMLIQLLENAVDNLLTTYEERQQTEFISLYLLQQEDHICLFMKYSGVVIPPEHWEKIFEIFHKIHQRTDVTGLRLYTAKLAAHRLDCEIKVIESNYNQTVFEILIPFMPQQAKQL
jgi:light-regulated signal transduction histidine kinase (bacteriophytochrome)